MEEFYIEFQILPYEKYTTIIRAKNKKEALKIALDSWHDEDFDRVEQIEVCYYEEI